MSEIIIVDSSPLIALARINQLEILQDLYAEVLVPSSVWEEITLRGIDRPGAYEISKSTYSVIHVAIYTTFIFS